jgi:hypothetical protein
MVQPVAYTRYKLEGLDKCESGQGFRQGQDLL